MKKSVGSIFLAFGLLIVLLNGCAPAAATVAPTQPPIATEAPAATEAPTAVPATHTTEPTKLPTPIETPFTGNWQGIDPYDGSITTILLVQTGNELVGTYEDSFSLNVNPPGYYGKGSGTISSSTTAQIIFKLSRWDGQTGKFGLQLTLSNGNNTLLINECLWNNAEDTEDCPMVMQRK